MFVSHEKSGNKKKYQKPNILRRRPCVSVRPNMSDVESPINTNAIIRYATLVPQPCTDESKQDHVYSLYGGISSKQQVALNVLPESCVSDISLNTSSKHIFDNNQINQECMEQGSLNVESFLNSAKGELKPSLKENPATDKSWCLRFDSKEIVVTKYEGSQLCGEDRNSDLMPGGVPSTVVSSLQPENSLDMLSTDVSAQNVTIDCFSSRVIKFKCDEPNCGKGFWNEVKLKKHKNTHNKQNRARSTQSVAECPVKKMNAEGVEERCGRTFLVREHLSKHLNEEHTPEDAMYRCTACARRFFWAAGLRAHRQAQCARGALACAWPGCGKQFRQPCRLREHARAHTGDRPYACPFPDCGWSFRSASKLQRHARRHTGERRHACGACGRAFLRREHLRDHCARCHPPQDGPAGPAAPRPARAARAPRAPRAPRTARTARRARTRTPAADDGLIVDPMTAVDLKCELDDNTSVIETVPVRPQDSMFVLSLVPETKVEVPCGELDSAEYAEGSAGEEEGHGGGHGGGEAEGHAARTHCTWPLARRHALYEQQQQQQHAGYVLEEDAPAEQSESSENNIYTIRSDLFLHGNVLINEDSEFIVSRDYVSRHEGESGEGEGAGEEGASEGGGERGAHLDAGLDYIDVHPTIDLMPEELMYADAAVDESSFRVFLLNGEELT